MIDIEPGDPRWTLAMEYERRGLLRPSQFRKQVPLADHKKWRKVMFKWGNEKHETERHRVAGFKEKTA